QNAGSDVINVDTYYDAMGHVYSTSNPYAGTRGSSVDATLNDYDELERPIKKTNPDSTFQVFSYSANVVTTKDESNNAWTRTSDALGRLTQVVEPNGATTNYTYTARGDLATVTQAGLSGDIARTRSFDYDWLSRLKQSFNPESGWICYGTTSGGAANGANCTADYDGNGNLGHKTNARGVVSSYTYDVLDRLNDITYSDGTPGRHWRYDFTPGWGGTYSGNNLGRLSQESTDTVNGQSTMKVLNYDAMGRVKFASEASPRETGIGTFHTTSADYDLAGNLIGITYPDGRKVAQGYDNAGRATSVSYASWNTTSKSYSYLTVPSAG
ncbi:MAG: RHS repeat protein, partial [Acidobacteriales bacterium]|nr:RHS repeat protein [Terriglobales bacterium]